MNSLDLSVEIAGIWLKNPIMNASGCFDPESMSQVAGMDLNLMGAIVSKGTTLEQRSGNSQPRIHETACGMINFIGLENPGMKVFLQDKLPFMAQYGVPVIVNISGFTIEEFAVMAKMVNQIEEVSAVEVNISCPNVHGGKIPFGCDPKIAAQVVMVVRHATDKPLIVKLTPNVTDIKVIAQAVVEAGADAISLINTVRGLFLQGDKIVTGGLSGPAIKPTALFMVHEVAQVVSVPIIGMGGITCLQDVFDFFKVGASAVAIGTANFKNPLVIMELIDQLEWYCAEHGLVNIDQVKEKVRGGK